MKITEEHKCFYLNELHKAGYYILDENIEIPMPDFLEPENFPFVIGSKSDSTAHLIHNWEDIINAYMGLSGSYEKCVEDAIAAGIHCADSELILTKRIMEGLKSVVDTKIQRGEFDAYSLEKQIMEFIGQPDVLMFIKKRQPELSKVPDDVIRHLENYFHENLKTYEITDIYRKSNHPDEQNLYSAVGERQDGYYACWTSWDEDKQSLNNGHYGLNNKEAAVGTIEKNFNDITGEIEKYGLENSRVALTDERQEQKYDNIIPFRFR